MIKQLDNILKTLLDSYKKTGYLKLALLSKANLDAKSNNLEEALVNFNQIINLTDGFNGNKVFNKIVSHPDISKYTKDSIDELVFETQEKMAKVYKELTASIK